jgi:hypothetical protein
MSDADKEIAVKINALLDLLKWFREHAVKIHLSPTKEGWNLKFTVPEKDPK